MSLARHKMLHKRGYCNDDTHKLIMKKKRVSDEAIPFAASAIANLPLPTLTIILRCSSSMGRTA